MPMPMTHRPRRVFIFVFAMNLLARFVVALLIFVSLTPDVRALLSNIASASVDAARGARISGLSTRNWGERALPLPPLPPPLLQPAALLARANSSKRLGGEEGAAPPPPLAPRLASCGFHPPRAGAKFQPREPLLPLLSPEDTERASTPRPPPPPAARKRPKKNYLASYTMSHIVYINPQGVPHANRT